MIIDELTNHSFLYSKLTNHIDYMGSGVRCSDWIARDTRYYGMWALMWVGWDVYWLFMMVWPRWVFLFLCKPFILFTHYIIPPVQPPVWPPVPQPVPPPPPVSPPVQPPTQLPVQPPVPPPSPVPGVPPTPPVPHHHQCHQRHPQCNHQYHHQCHHQGHTAPPPTNTNM